MLSWEYPPHVIGGLGSHVADLLPALDESGIQVVLVTPRWKGGARQEALPGGSIVHRVDPPVPELGNFLADVQTTNVSLQSVAHVLFDTMGPFDAIHVHDWLVGFAGIALKHFYRTPLVATIHATERGRTGGGLHNDLNVAVNGNEWWLAYESWRVIATTHYMAQQVIDYFQAPWDKIDVIPNGVYTARYEAMPPRGSPELLPFRERFARDDEAIVYHVGRLVGEKGPQHLVEAAPGVLAAAPRTKFVIAGRGPMLEPMHWRTAELGLDDRFYFTGFIPDEDRNLLYRVADVAVFPSLYEPFGIVALEAMAALAPVVVGKAGGFAEIVEHNETGIHVWPGDVGSLAWGINHTLAHPAWSRARAAHAFRRLREVYDWHRIAALTAQVYRRVAAERAAADW
jgi:glycosyltransferase involved in cell wall biosynthesis